MTPTDDDVVCEFSMSVVDRKLAGGCNLCSSYSHVYRKVVVVVGLTVEFRVCFECGHALGKMLVEQCR